MNDITVLVFPAPAGINRFQTIDCGTPHSVPRASGDKPCFRRIPLAG
ncbi:TPA: hypothetical protein IRC98_002314 [Salmonella enterica subsp. enterica serovar Livingstone]|uniref:Uncharacterized protein n=1 Tax=Salmonella enterica TaxID=28901 RepID=A0A761WTU6_SALER|nr:hypothetical protein [Salmonella enterica]HAG3438317.1 hypothetical protein [Salmonella enterica]HAG4241857.1 hypothetical protein [Salmonella enterica]HAO7848203.1 hypothetical protein [Salmonella enterica subsp. enterica serovar Livingstone]HAO8130113.1 hypothetical protein [Salmonella enterica subsp. enterica serovar Livingstone]